MLAAKNPPADAGDARDASSIPRSGRSPGGGHGNPLQYSCLENPTDRRAWRATVHRVVNSRTPLSVCTLTHTHSHTHTHTVRDTPLPSSLGRGWRSLYQACLFPVAYVTNDHKLSILKQNKFGLISLRGLGAIFFLIRKKQLLVGIL